MNKQSSYIFIYIHPGRTRVGFGTTAAESNVEIADQEKNLYEIIKTPSAKSKNRSALSCAGLC